MTDESFQDEVGPLLGRLSSIEEPHDVGMIETRQDVRFETHPVYDLRHRETLSPQNLRQAPSTRSLDFVDLRELPYLEPSNRPERSSAKRVARGHLHYARNINIVNLQFAMLHFMLVGGQSGATVTKRG